MDEKNRGLMERIRKEILLLEDRFGETELTELLRDILSVLEE